GYYFLLLYVWYSHILPFYSIISLMLLLIVVDVFRPYRLGPPQDIGKRCLYIYIHIQYYTNLQKLTYPCCLYIAIADSATRIPKDF
ncbi:hypothetical protein NDU88_005902, partial [Pleurodeles waltl]